MTTIRMVVPQQTRQELISTINSLSGLVRKERGCRAYDLYMDIENVDVFILMEEWDSQEDFDRHVRAPFFSTLLGVLTLCTERPDIRINSVVNTAGMEKIKALRAA